MRVRASVRGLRWVAAPSPQPLARNARLTPPLHHQSVRGLGRGLRWMAAPAPQPLARDPRSLPPCFGEIRHGRPLAPCFVVGSAAWAICCASAQAADPTTSRVLALRPLTRSSLGTAVAPRVFYRLARCVNRSAAFTHYVSLHGALKALPVLAALASADVADLAALGRPRHGF